MFKLAKDIRKGEVIIFNGRLMKVDDDPTIVKPGKGAAFAQVKLRDVKKHNTIEERFRTDINLEKATLTTNEAQFLFFNGSSYVFLNKDTFEQIEIEPNIVTEHQKMFLFNEIIVNLVYYETEILNIELPQTVDLQIISKDMFIKNAQTNPSYKRAILENNIETKVPAYISEGDIITIKTSDLSYVGRKQAKG